MPHELYSRIHINRGEGISPISQSILNQFSINFTLISFVSEFYYMSNGLTSKILIKTSRSLQGSYDMDENSVCKISWELVENWLRNPRNSIILVDKFNVYLTIVKKSK